jgi:outer membrane protein
MKNGVKVAVLAALASGMGITGTAMAFEPGEWLVRAGAMNVDPKSDNHEVVSVDDAISATIGFTYMMTDVWAIDVLAAYPFEHDIELVGGPKVGSTKHLPPTVSLQWRPKPNGMFQPYFGLGFNYTKFFSEDTTGLLEGTKLSLDDSWGFAGQAGFDIVINENVFINFDVRYANIESDAKINGVKLGPFIEDAFGVNFISSTVKIDPMVYGAHVGFRF